jgi:hypothetical protein
MRLIKLKISVPPHELVTKAKQLADKHGFGFSGDTEKGQIRGAGIEARYLVREDELTINILKKPALLSWTRVEQKIVALVNMSKHAG